MHKTLGVCIILSIEITYLLKVYTMTNDKIVAVEFVGTIFGVIGAFSVAFGIFHFGYAFFFVSSLFLAGTAYYQNNANLFTLQLVFMMANIAGLINFGA